MAILTGSTLNDTEFTPPAVGIFNVRVSGRARLLRKNSGSSTFSPVKNPDNKDGDLVDEAMDCNNQVASTVYKWMYLSAGATSEAAQ